MTNQKAKVWVYFSTYGSHKHDVLVIQPNGEAYDTRYAHTMLDPHNPNFGDMFFHALAPYMNEQHEVVFLETPNNN